MIRLILLALLFVSAQAFGQTVTDGDTIKANGVIYRLWGIDAPESNQTCADGWAAGREATKAILELMRGRSVECDARGQDRYRRTIALCRADGRDLGADMVRAGMAWAFLRYSHDYVSEEAEAKAAGLGLHVHGCQPAWEWRAQRR